MLLYALHNPRQYWSNSCYGGVKTLQVESGILLQSDHHDDPAYVAENSSPKMSRHAANFDNGIKNCLNSISCLYLYLHEKSIVFYVLCSQIFQKRFYFLFVYAGIKQLWCNFMILFGSLFSFSSGYLISPHPICTIVPSTDSINSFFKTKKFHDKLNKLIYRFSGLIKFRSTKLRSSFFNSLTSDKMKDAL